MLNGDANAKIDHKTDNFKLLKSEKALSDAQMIATDCWCFNALRWAHLITFVLQILSFYLKYKEWFNSSQILQGMVIPWFYMGAALYNIFEAKFSRKEWEHDFEISKKDPSLKFATEEVRGWLYIEVTLFFLWIFCSMGFTLYAYIFKVKSIVKSSVVMEMDDNVWNDKDTDDFLRYLKFEYFMVTYFAVKFAFQVILGFDVREDVNWFGKRDFNPVTVIFILLLATTCVSILNITLLLTDVDDEAVNRDGDVYSR